MGVALFCLLTLGFFSTFLECVAVEPTGNPAPAVGPEATPATVPPVGLKTVPASVPSGGSPVNAGEAVPPTVTCPAPPTEVTDKEVDALDLDANAPPEEGGGAAPSEQSDFLGVDYGTYFESMRRLDDYRIRLYQAVDLAQQLALPYNTGDAYRLISLADQHKSRFETVYLSGSVEEGMKEYAEASRLLLEGVSQVTPPIPIEGRAVWLDRSSIVASASPEGLRALFARFKSGGINMVFVETLNAGYPIYPSKILPQNPLIQGWDPLQVAVEEGHKLGMEVHAWVWTFAVGNTRHNPLIGKPSNYPGPILSREELQGEALRMENGSIMPPRQTEYWLSPASPRARHFLLEVFTEIVKTYPVDGLQLDYIRYPFQQEAYQAGFESVGRVRFNQETGMAVGHAPSGNLRRVWAAWKAYQVTSFVKSVSETLKGIRPTLKLSAAVFPLPRAQRILAIHQDWETWIDRGWIDSLHPMIYTSSARRLSRVFGQVSASASKNAFIYPGLALYRMDPPHLFEELDALREMGGMGWTLFAAAHLSDQMLSVIRPNPQQKTPALIPHQDPMRATQAVLNDFQGYLQQILHDPKNSIKPVVSQKPVETALVETAVADVPAEPPGVVQPTPISVSNAVSGSLPNPFVEMETAVKMLETCGHTLKNNREAWIAFANALDNVDRSVDPWFLQESESHPLRVRYLQGLLGQMHNLTAYSLARLPAAAATQQPGQPIKPAPKTTLEPFSANRALSLLFQ